MSTFKNTTILVLWMSHVIALGSAQSVMSPEYDVNASEEIYLGKTTLDEESDAPVPAPLPPPFDYSTLNGSNQNNDTSRQPGPTALEILVAIFFFVAAAWLLIAVFYALLALVVLRLRSRGRLDLYDEEFGRMYVWRNRYYIPCGCLLRRYVVTFGHDQSGNREGRSRSRDYKHITRSERRLAIEKILFNHDGSQPPKKNPATMEEEVSPDIEMFYEKRSVHENGIDTPESEQSTTNNSEEPLCSICLAEYDDGERIFQSTVCNHKYHSDCICDWLERRKNTECPCCRQPLVDESQVWKAVKKARKAKRRQAKRQHLEGSWFPMSKKSSLGSFWSAQQFDGNRSNENDGDGKDSYEDGDTDVERGAASQHHRRQGTMITFNSLDNDQEANQNSDGSVNQVHAEIVHTLPATFLSANDECPELSTETTHPETANFTLRDAIEVLAEGSESTLDAPLDEESSQRLDPAGLIASE